MCVCVWGGVGGGWWVCDGLVRLSSCLVHVCVYNAYMCMCALMCVCAHVCVCTCLCEHSFACICLSCACFSYSDCIHQLKLSSISEGPILCKHYVFICLCPT